MVLGDIYDLIEAYPKYTNMSDEELLTECKAFYCEIQEMINEIEILENKITTIKNYIEWRKTK